MSSQIPQTSVAHFIKKTYQILQNEAYQQIILWLPSGKDFAIKDVPTFEQEILPLYFRHRNIHSFIRQLNMYGFHKSRKDPSKNIFSNQFFKRGRDDLLPQVRRKGRVEDKNTENFPPGESEQPVLKSCCEPNVEIPQLKEKISNLVPELVKKQSQERQVERPQEDRNRCSLNLLICPSEVMNENPDVYSNMRVQEDAYSSSDSENISIDDQIEKERKMSVNLRSGVSLVQTHNLLKTHNHILEG